jgi:hypothetical protein
MNNGFELTGQGLVIKKDPGATITYGFDWSEWLVSPDTISSIVWSVQARLNDPMPITATTSGIEGTISYVELSGGQINKVYKVTAEITTSSGIIDRRYFNCRVEEKSG